MTTTDYTGSLVAQNISSTEILTLPNLNSNVIVPSGSLKYNTATNLVNYSDGTQWLTVGGSSFIPPARTIRVAQQNGDFDNLPAAITAAIALIPTLSNGVKITVHPGTYIITSPITVPSFVSIVGISLSAKTQIFQYSDTTNTTFTMQANSHIIGITINGGGAGLTSNSDCSLRDCIITNCALVGILGSLGMKLFMENIEFITCFRDIDATDGSVIIARNISISQTTNISLLLRGGSNVTINEARVSNPLTFINADVGSMATLNNFTLEQSSTFYGLLRGTIYMNNWNVPYVLGGPNSGFTVASTARLFGSGNRIHPSQLSSNPLSSALILNYSDERGNISGTGGNFEIGLIGLGSFTHIGKGGPSVQSMRVFKTQNDATGALISTTEVTSSFLLENNTGTPAFDSENLNSSIIVGSTARWKAIQIRFITGYATSSKPFLVFERNVTGVSWTPIPVMSVTDLNIPQGDELMKAGVFTYHFQPIVNTSSFGLTSGRWIRIRRIIADTTNPEIDYIRIIPDTTRLDLNGFQTHYGRSQARKSIEMFKNPFASLVNPASNIDLYYTSLMAINRPYIRLTVSPIDSSRITDTFTVPYDMDTSRNIEIVLKMACTTEEPLFNLFFQLTVRVHKIDSLDYDQISAPVNPSLPLQTTTLFSPFIQGQFLTRVLTFNAQSFNNTFPNRDDIAVSISREPVGLTTPNSYSGDIVIFSVSVVYSSWSNGAAGENI